MKQKDKFRYAEKCLYNYKPNLACLEVLKDDLLIKQTGSDVHAQNYNSSFDSAHEPASPVFSYVASLETLEERIKYLERFTNPITKLLDDLLKSDKSEFLQILNLMYFSSNTQKKVMLELDIPRSSFDRKRRNLVNLAINYLGL